MACAQSYNYYKEASVVGQEAGSAQAARIHTRSGVEAGVWIWPALHASSLHRRS